MQPGRENDDKYRKFLVMSRCRDGNREIALLSSTSFL